MMMNRRKFFGLFTLGAAAPVSCSVAAAKERVPLKVTSQYGNATTFLVTAPKPSKEALWVDGPQFESAFFERRPDGRWEMVFEKVGG